MGAIMEIEASLYYQLNFFYKSKTALKFNLLIKKLKIKVFDFMI